MLLVEVVELGVKLDGIANIVETVLSRLLSRKTVELKSLDAKIPATVMPQVLNCSGSDIVRAWPDIGRRSFQNHVSEPLRIGHTHNGFAIRPL